MRDLLGAGSTWLHGKAKTDASKAVSYARGLDSVTLRARKTGRRDQSVDASAGLMTEVREWDWILTASDLVLASVATEPHIGDRITETIDGTDFVFEVLATGSEGCWRWNDRNQTAYRVHAKLMEG